MIPVPQTTLDFLTQAFGTTAASLAHVGGGHESSDGVVYAYSHQETRRLLKIMAIPVQDKQIGMFCLDERMRFMHFLGEHGAQIAFPQLSPQENLYETFRSEAHVWIAYCMDVAPGETPSPRAWNPVLFRRWGQTIGLLHRLTQQYPSWQGVIEPVSGIAYLTWLNEWQGFYAWCQDDDVKQKWVEIKEQLQTLPVTRDAFGFIHNDPHIWNLLADGNRITLLDFDVANHHWFINDVAIACQSILAYQSGGMGQPVRNRGKLTGFLRSFLDGYAQEHQLTSAWLDRLNLFIAYRRILLFIVMHGWIQSQPGLHDSWKQMILEQPDVVGPFTTAGGLL